MRHVLPLTLAALALASPVLAQTPPPPLVRTMLQTAALDGDRHATAMAQVRVQPGRGGVPRHIHAGVEMGYVLDGTGVLLVDGQAPRTLKAGDSYQVPEGVPHSFTNGDMAVTLLAVYVTEKDKPLSSPAP